MMGLAQTALSPGRQAQLMPIKRSHQPWGSSATAADSLFCILMFFITKFKVCVLFNIIPA